ncbi:MAG TPA: hypothetical protein VHP33_22375 [Polyangiaceae bacterium]|nr:hypothetical protein [Polyangiaceae bacterium]
MTSGLRFSAVVLLGAELVSGCSLADAGGGDPKDGGGAGTSTTAGTSFGGTAPGGGMTSTGGSAGAPSAAGTLSAGGSAGSTATGGAGGAGGGAGTASAGTSAGGGGGGVLCPADATFCSGFEENKLPTGAVYKFNAAPGEWTRDFEVDTTLFKSGKSSLRVKAGSADTGASGAYQMLAVPAPSGKFWVRLYIQQTELDIGESDHNVFGGAASTDEPNSPGMIEFAEDVGVSFNTSDDVRWPAGFGRINGTPMPFKLPKGMWHCIEINYDSATRAQKLYVNGALQIDATDYPKTVAAPVSIFKFGFNKLHGPARKIWFDDVAVGPTRAGCL